MDQSRHPATMTRAAPVEPHDLPEGWHVAERDEWDDVPMVTRRRLVLRLVLVGVIVAGVLGVFVWVAAAHYARGVDALHAHAYARALDELSSAKILGLPFRDANSLEEQAQRGMESEAATLKAQQDRIAAVVDRLDKARAKVGAGDAAGVLVAVKAIPRAGLRMAIAAGDTAQVSADGLEQDLTAAAESALQGGQWERAGKFASALLVLEPSSKPGASLAARALTGEKLRAKLTLAKGAAQHHHWREALRLALAVVAVRKDFPGAATLVADARRALTPKPTPTKTTAPAAPAPAVAAPSTSVTTTTPSQPSAPPPP